MANLSSLKSNLRYWQGKRDEIDGDIKDLKQRKKDVERIQKTLQRTASNNSGDVNRKLNSLASALDAGMKYSKSPDLSGKTDDGVGDSNVAAANSELNKELGDINGDISDKNSELEYAKRQISSYRSQISEEERRQRQESLKTSRTG